MSEGTPWAFQTWALATPVGSPLRKAVLMALAVRASDAGRCETKQDRLAKDLEMGARTVRGHLKALEEAGLIERRQQHRYDGSRRGDEFLLLAPWVDEWPDGHPATAAGRSNRQDGYPSPGTSSAAQEPPLENHHAKQENAHDAREHVPDDFPDELRPHAREVMRVLCAVAEQHGARKVWPRAVGLAIMAHPRRPLVETAHALAVWAVDPPRQIKDVVGTYRSFLTRERDLAATERLDGGGKRPENVSPIRRNGRSPAEQARVERQAARFDRLGITMEGINA